MDVEDTVEMKGDTLPRRHDHNDNKCMYDAPVTCEIRADFTPSDSSMYARSCYVGSYMQCFASIFVKYLAPAWLMAYEQFLYICKLVIC